MSHAIRNGILSTSSLAALGAALATVSAPAAMAQDTLTDDRVVVTGSRIARRDFQANSPIVTVDESTFENRSSFSVEAALNQLPQFSPGQSQNLASGGGSPFLDASQAPGAATLNLRGLGSNRSLVLLNGRRPQPINAFLVVDVNTIPSAAIQNVEVITGGAAAVYGADAIAGVVNFILKDDYEGIEVDGQYGIAEAGDNKTAQFSALIGGNFSSGRGNALLGLQWADRGPVYQRNREFYTRAWNDPGTSAGSVNNAVPGLTQYNLLGFLNFGLNSDGSTFNVAQADNPAAPYTGPLNSQTEGAGYKLNPLTNAAATFRSLGYNDPENQLSIPLTRYSTFASAHYDVTDTVTAFLEANYTHTYAEAVSLVPPAFNFWSLSMPYSPTNDDPDSPTFGADQTNFHPVSPQLADILNARAVPGANWVMTRSLDFLGRLKTDTTTNVYQVTGGFRGELPVRDWTWEVYGSHGETDVLSQQLSGSISQEKLQQIIDGRAVSLVNGVQVYGDYTATGPWGQGWTNGPAGTFSTATVGSCSSGIPIFNADGSVPYQVNVSQDCVDYATLKTNSFTTLQQDIIEATVQGGLFENWAGEIRYAAGATYRDVRYQFVPDSGLNAQQARANVINIISLPQESSGEIAATEVYGELLVPLLADIPFVQELNLELGGRYSDYDTTGGEETYKILGDWGVNDYLRFRGGYQLATRSPNVYELFTPIATSPDFSATNDPCTNIPGFTAEYGNLDSNPNRVNLQLACAELISRDGGFAYTTLATDPTNTGQPASAVGTPGFDATHISNFRNTVPGYNIPFPITLALVQGNAALESEEAETWTFGGVVTSPFTHPLLSQVSLSVDWYSIDLSNTIDTPSAITVYQQCLDPEFNPLVASSAGSVTGADILANNPYCALINREPTNFAGVAGGVGSGIDRNYNAQFVNLGGTKTSGIDIALNWAAEFADMGLSSIPGSLSVNFLASFLDKFDEAPFEGAEYIEYAGTLANGGLYDYKTFTTVTWRTDGYSLGARIRYLPDILPAPGSTLGTQGAESHTEVDLFGRYIINDNYELRAGIDNLLDELPEVVGRTPFNNALSSTNGNYDTLGRRFYLGATARF